MLPEYNFTGGVRGKHAQAYRQGHSVTIHPLIEVESPSEINPIPQLREREPLT